MIPNIKLSVACLTGNMCEYTRINPHTISPHAIDMMVNLTKGYDWSESFSVRLPFCRVAWITPDKTKVKHGERIAPVGVLGYQWLPLDGETVDATGAILPGISIRDEEEVMRGLDFPEMIFKHLESRPHVVVNTTIEGANRWVDPCFDGQNRIKDERKLLMRMSHTMTLFGVTALRQIWGIDVFN